MFRGILSTMYLETIGNNNAKKVYNFLKRYHKKNAFVKVCKFNTGINTSEVMHTNYCNISVCKNRKRGTKINKARKDESIKDN